jgi:hypothetical protein
MDMNVSMALLKRPNRCTPFAPPFSFAAVYLQDEVSHQMTQNENSDLKFLYLISNDSHYF